MDIALLFAEIAQAIWCLPFLLFFFGTCVFMTLKLNFVQFRYFTDSIRSLFKPHQDSSASADSGKLSPFQAFINTLGGNIGNGSLAGVPTAIAAGGPGAIFWMIVMSTFSVALRFAEVFLATYFSSQATEKKSGPMLYLSMLPYGAVWSFLFTIFAFAFMVTGGNMIQCNAVGIAMHRTWGIDKQITAFIIFLLIGYVVVGGAGRIVAFLDKLVPLKVYGFLISAIIVLAYHYAQIPHALYLICSLAFNPQAVLGGTLGFALQRTIALGFSRGVNASEAGLGTAAIAFGTSKGSDPMQSSVMSMLSVFVNSHIICFLVALCVITSGAYQSGETSTAMLIAAYETVFGSMGGIIVSLLTMMFAFSVVVAVAFNSRICWQFLLSGRLSFLFSVLYVGCAVAGTLMRPLIVWDINSISTAGLFAVNVIGLLYFANTIKTYLNAYAKNHA